ncbi:MAG TPA: heme-binding domain-containing protein, partial [Acidimicrobiales bacterium]|nr:heme-binding domain-containing protein [Acidimicrobiales bacterium]
ETDWPIYSYVAPMSWLVRRDVGRGRDELGFSTWDEDGGDADDAAEAILDGSMPPWPYTLLHPGARLSDEEEAILVAALEAMDEVP